MIFSEHLIIDSDENRLPGRLESRAVYPSSCSGGRLCVPVSDCQGMYYEAAKSCFAGDRTMFCGGTQYDPYICCPKSPVELNRVCGKSLVSGQFYRGLGAFPFVARIGFKSECERQNKTFFFSSEISMIFCSRNFLLLRNVPKCDLTKMK